MRLHALALATTIAACHSPSHARVDAGVGQLGVRVVVDELGPLSAIELPPAIDTDACSTVILDANGREQCMIAGDTITATANVQISGTRPLVLFATGDIVVQSGAMVDAASHHDKDGPGADGSCAGAAGGAADDVDYVGGGGGAGGSFQGEGGDGAWGATNGGLAAGGQAAPGPPATALRGGCAGGAGGSGPAGGTGGGAIYLLALGTIGIHGAINASGAAGAGDGGNGIGGGSGGGSGGMIALDASSITIDGVVLASGGGGGCGASNGFTTGSTPGADPDPSTPSTPAAGCAPPIGAALSAAGGDGSAIEYSGLRGQVHCEGEYVRCGGGGGGGGAGYILVRGATELTGVSVPPLQVL